MKMRHIAGVVVLLFLLSLTAAAQDRSSGPSCSQCNNRLSEAEKRFSVVLKKIPGMGPSSYDDIGCAVISRNSECATRQMMFDGSSVAHDYLTASEVPVETAYFVFKTDVSTPRGYGIVAFKDKAQAEQFAAEQGKGKVIRWFELVDERLE
jgi:copper chaperone NosL